MHSHEEKTDKPGELICKYRQIRGDFILNNGDYDKVADPGEYRHVSLEILCNRDLDWSISNVMSKRIKFPKRKLAISKSQIQLTFVILVDCRLDKVMDIAASHVRFFFQDFVQSVFALKVLE